MTRFGIAWIFLSALLGALLVPSAPARAQETGLEGLETVVNEMGREIERLGARVAEHEKARAKTFRELGDLRQYLAGRLAPAVGYRVHERPSGLPASYGVDAGKVRSAVDRSLRALREAVLVIPAKAYLKPRRQVVKGGFARKLDESRVEVGYLDPKAPQAAASVSLERLVEIQQDAMNRMLTDIQSIVAQFAVLELRTLTEVGQLTEQLETKGRAIERKDNDIKALEAKNAKLEAQVKKLNAALEILRPGR